MVIRVGSPDWRLQIPLFVRRYWGTLWILYLTSMSPSPVRNTESPVSASESHVQSSTADSLGGKSMPMERSSNSESDILRRSFLYGTSMSGKLLAELLTGNRKNADWVQMRRKPATLMGYVRTAVVDADFPIVVEGSKEGHVEGYLFYPRYQKDLQRIAEFERE
jgi:Gamma-glutamyl cyclotransferase, AIG2-like